MTDLEAGGIDETNATAPTETVFEINTQRHQGRGEPIDEALIAGQAWERFPPVLTDMLLIEVFEIAVRLLVEPDENGHDFTQAQGAPTPAMFYAIAKLRRLPEGFKVLAKIIDLAKQVF